MLPGAGLEEDARQVGTHQPGGALHDAVDDGIDCFPVVLAVTGGSQEVVPVGPGGEGVGLDHGEPLQVFQEGGELGGKEAVRRTLPQGPPHQLTLIAPGYHLLVVAQTGVHAVLIQGPVEGAQGCAVEPGRLHVDEHGVLVPGGGHLPQVLPLFHIAGVDAGAVDEADVSVKSLLSQCGHTAQQSGHRVVEDHEGDPLRPLGSQGGGEVPAQLFVLGAGNLNLLGDVEDPAVPVGEDLGGVGEAQSPPTAAACQGKDGVGDLIHKGLPGNGRLGAGHGEDPQVLHHRSIVCDGDQADAEVGAAGVDDDGGGILWNVSVQGQVGGEHHHPGLRVPPEPFSHVGLKSPGADVHVYQRRVQPVFAQKCLRFTDDLGHVAHLSL